MTAQIQEKIIINDRIEYMYETPDIPEYRSFSHKKVDHRISSCWRGYVGMWRIIDDRLYVLDIDSPGYNIENNIIKLFNEPIFAMWYTGTISIHPYRYATYNADNFKVVYEIVNGYVKNITAFGDDYKILNSYATLELQEIFKNKDIKAELLKAINTKDIGKIDLMAYLKIDVNFKYDDSKTPLLIAVEKSNENIIFALIDAGANVNISDKYGTTPLMIAIITGDIEKIFAVLNSDNVDFGLKNINGLTALGIALNFYYENKNNVDWDYICTVLLSRILDCSLDHFSGDAEYALITAAEKGDINSVKKLINTGMYLDIQKDNNAGESALITSLMTNHIDIAELLINAGSNTDIVTDGPFKLSALTLAQLKGLDFIVSKLKK